MTLCNDSDILISILDNTEIENNLSNHNVIDDFMKEYVNDENSVVVDQMKSCSIKDNPKVSANNFNGAVSLGDVVGNMLFDASSFDNTQHIYLSNNVSPLFHMTSVIPSNLITSVNNLIDTPVTVFNSTSFRSTNPIMNSPKNSVGLIPFLDTANLMDLYNLKKDFASTSHESDILNLNNTDIFYPTLTSSDLISNRSHHSFSSSSSSVLLSPLYQKDNVVDPFVCGKDLVSLHYARDSLAIMSGTMDYLVNLLDDDEYFYTKGVTKSGSCVLSGNFVQNVAELDQNKQRNVKFSDSNNGLADSGSTINDGIDRSGRRSILVSLSDKMDDIVCLLNTMSSLMNESDGHENLVTLDDIKNDLVVLTSTMNDLLKFSETKIVRSPDHAQIKKSSMECLSDSDDDMYMISSSQVDLITIPDIDEDVQLLLDEDESVSTSSETKSDLINLSDSRKDLITFDYSCNDWLLMSNAKAEINLIDLGT